MAKRARSIDPPLQQPPKSVQQKYNDGDYKSKLEILSKPREPEAMRKRAVDLNSEQIRTLSTVKANYENDLRLYRESRDKYREDAARLVDQFRADIEAENGMVDHPKADKVWSMAWDRGHGSGLGDVIIYYEELADLVKD